MSNWYLFSQNNSGGWFAGPAIHVWVEATSHEEANEKAEEAGLYFDGSGDCACCGARWYPQQDWSTFYDAPEEGGWTVDWSSESIPFSLLLHLDGRAVPYAFQEKYKK